MVDAAERLALYKAALEALEKQFGFTIVAKLQQSISGDKVTITPVLNIAPVRDWKEKGD